MAIYNKVELQALAVSRFPVGVQAGSSAQDVIDQAKDERDSGDTYAGIMSGSGGTLSLTTSLSDVDTFSTNITPANDLFAPDQANNRIEVKEPCNVDCGVIFQGQWADNTDVTFELWVIDSNNPAPGIKHPGWIDITQSGSGSGRTVDMFKKRVVPMGANAPWSFDFDSPVYVYMRAKAGSSTTVTQVYIQLSPEYLPYSIRDF